MTESLAASIGVLCDHYAATLEAAHVERLDLRDRYEASDGKEAHLLLANLAWTVTVLGRMIALTEHIVLSVADPSEEVLSLMNQMPGLTREEAKYRAAYDIVLLQTEQRGVHIVPSDALTDDD